MPTATSYGTASSSKQAADIDYITRENGEIKIVCDTSKALSILSSAATLAAAASWVAKAPPPLDITSPVLPPAEELDATLLVIQGHHRGEEGGITTYDCSTYESE